MTNGRHGLWIRAVGSVLLATGCSGGGNNESVESGAIGAGSSCMALNGKMTSGSVTLSAVAVSPAGPIPGYCKVNGTIPKALNFEVRLPLSWNGKLHYGGGGGYNGSIPALSGINLAALVKGYATVSSDSGHQASGGDASFALNDPIAAQLFGGVSIPLVSSAATDVVRLAFGSLPVKTYFQGCSNGGREALVGAQRYPQLFDGIIAQAPAYNWTGLIGAFNRNVIALSSAQIPYAKVQLLARSVLNTCDKLDGLSDGVTSNQAACVATYSPLALRCANGLDSGNACLSDPQLAAISAITSVTSFTGTGTVYSNQGWTLTGSEDDAGAWVAGITGDANFAAGQQYLYQDTTIKNYLAKNSSTNSLAYAPYNQNPAALDTMAALNDATSTNLSPLSAKGSKLILWHGGNDPLISANNTTAYYNGLISAMGGQASVDGFARYYIAPGVDHCGGGPGADVVDLLAALDNWVSNNVAPENLVASKVGSDGSVALTRPLCRFPKYPRYVGPANDASSAKIAANFSCVAP